jgi:excisionase family DNA binding protein
MTKHYSQRPPIVPTRVYSRTEVAEILNVSLSTVKRLLAGGQLRASQPPGLRRVFITGQAILDMLEEHTGHYLDEAGEDEHDLDEDRAPARS